MHNVQAQPHHDALHKELSAVMKKYADTYKMSQMEVLAVVSVMTGQVLALQDQSAHTPEEYMQLVADNIELGNQTIVNQLRDAKPAGSA